MEEKINGITKDKYNQYCHDYISNVSLDDIEFIKLNREQLLKFYYQNYFDEENECFKYWIEKGNVVPFGMEYLTLNENAGNSSYLLGICNNNINTKTIVCCVIYDDKCYIADEQIKPITVLKTVEVNYFFRGKGLINRIYSYLSNIIDKEQNILITSLSPMGSMCNLFETLKLALKKSGFNQDIRLEDELNEEYFTKVLVKR